MLSLNRLINCADFWIFLCKVSIWNQVAMEYDGRSFLLSNPKGAEHNSELTVFAFKFHIRGHIWTVEYSKGTCDISEFLEKKMSKWIQFHFAYNSLISHHPFSHLSYNFAPFCIDNQHKLDVKSQWFLGAHFFTSTVVPLVLSNCKSGWVEIINSVKEKSFLNVILIPAMYSITSQYIHSTLLFTL